MRDKNLFLFAVLKMRTSVRKAVHAPIPAIML